MLEAIIRVLAPHYCISCGTEDSLLCDACRMAELRPVPSRCYSCLKLTQDHAVCKSCRRHGPLANVWAGAEYTEIPKQLIHRLKFERARAGHVPIAKQLHETLPYHAVTVVPIPTATSRMRQRGYDQSKLIARQFALLRQLPCQELLERRGQTRQVGAERAVRISQAQSFFEAKPYASFPKSVLLIDDVLTTGATLQAAAKCLKTAGVRTVYAATFAQKQ